MYKRCCNARSFSCPRLYPHPETYHCRFSQRLMQRSARYHNLIMHGRSWQSFFTQILHGWVLSCCPLLCCWPLAEDDGCGPLPGQSHCVSNDVERFAMKWWSHYGVNWSTWLPAVTLSWHCCERPARSRLLANCGRILSGAVLHFLKPAKVEGRHYKTLLGNRTLTNVKQ